MSLFTIAWRSLQQRWFASALTSFSMALGVTLVVAVVTIHGILSAQFKNNATLGYNLIVGAKGGRLQLTLNSVYYLSQPVENIDYRFYTEFLPTDERAAQLKNSYAYQAHEAAWNSLQLSNSLVSSAMPASRDWASSVANNVLKETAEDSFGFEQEGAFSNFTAFTVPLCMGDYYGPFRVIGTTPAMFDVLPEAAGKDFSFAQGRNFEHWNKEHGYFEAVAGSAAAREMNIKVGSEVNPAHGDPEGHSHENGFVVVGILAPTGTPNDRAVFVNMEGFYLMSNHAKPLPDKTEEDDSQIEDEQASNASAAQEDDPDSGKIKPTQREMKALPLEQRELTAFLYRTANPFVAGGVQNKINEGEKAQAVQPVKEIYELLDMIVTPIQQILLVLTLMIIVVSGVSILVSIYNSMSERRHEIAVMRALGAGRSTVMWIILLESMMLAFAGGILGWVIGHGLNWVASPIIESRTGFAIGMFDFAPPVNLFDMFQIEPPFDWLARGEVYPELLLIPVLMGLAIVVGILPAISAYRTDVAESLGK